MTRVVLGCAVSVAVVAGAVGVGLAATASPAGKGRLGGLSGLGITTIGVPTKPETTYLLDMVPTCSKSAPVRIVSVKAHGTVGSVTLGRAGTHVIQPGESQLIKMGKPQAALPTQYRLDVPLPRCPHSGDLGIEAMRHGTGSAGILGLDITYQDEKGTRHMATLTAVRYALCGQATPAFTAAMGKACG